MYGILIYPKKGVDLITAKFVRDRITQLRLQKGISEYKMSYDLGHSRGYINNISSGKALPSLGELFAICEYFDISVVEFFNESNTAPILMKDTLKSLSKLSEEDLALVKKVADRMAKK